MCVVSEDDKALDRYGEDYADRFFTPHVGPNSGKPDGERGSPPAVAQF
jgi:hypothetical protein